MRPKVSTPPVRKSDAPTNPHAELLARPNSDVADAHPQTPNWDKTATLAASGGEKRRGNGRVNGGGSGKGNGRGNSRGNDRANKTYMERRKSRKVSLTGE